jgi:hypothetical protein
LRGCNEDERVCSGLLKEGDQSGSQNEKKKKEYTHRASNNRCKGEKKIRHSGKIVKKSQHRQSSEWVDGGHWKEKEERIKGEN